MASTPFDRLRMILGDEESTGQRATNEYNAQRSQVIERTNEMPERCNVTTTNASHPKQGYLNDAVCDGGVSTTPGDVHLQGLTSMSTNEKTRGELGPLGDYCPILAVSKFPYRYMNPKSTTSDRISKGFFAEDRFWNNLWTVYYVQVPPALSSKALLVVPRLDVEQFLDKISFRSGIPLQFPSASTGFVVSFGGDGSPRPRYLGMSACRDEFQRLEAALPTARLDFQVKSDGSIVANCDQRTFQDWAASIEKAIDATRNRNRASKEKRKQQRVVTKTDWSRQLRRAQRYLALRASTTSIVAKLETTLEDGHSINADLPSSSEGEIIINLTEPTSLPFESNVIFISIDVEAYERGHQQITEIGIAVLDTADLKLVPPGDDGRAWMEVVKGRHLWIKENAHLVNTDFITGCPDRYEASFGVTESISLGTAVNVLERCFQDPAKALMIKEDSLTGTSCPATSNTINVLAAGKDPAELTSTAPRKIVVVGHDINQDLAYLQSIKFDLLNAPNVLEILDTSELYRSMTHEDSPPSVSTMLYNLGISGWNLHNAGNDAAYTLQSLIGIAVRCATGGDTHLTETSRLITEAKQEAEERVRSNLEEWEIASDNAEVDGGSPQDPVKRVTPRKGIKQTTKDGESV